LIGESGSPVNNTDVYIEAPIPEAETYVVQSSEVEYPVKNEDHPIDYLTQKY
jgi:hypothetical protein